MKPSWFTRKGIFFLPASFMGWIIFMLAAAYAIYRFIDIDSRSHSASDTLINWVFNLLLIGLVYSVIGFFTEKKKEIS
jgi:hypothetical protein